MTKYGHHIVLTPPITPPAFRRLGARRRLAPWAQVVRLTDHATGILATKSQARMSLELKYRILAHRTNSRAHKCSTFRSSVSGFSGV
ncbi:hypothetical protein MTO96_041000 [Rhipicephalus appendiculatus]